MLSSVSAGLEPCSFIPAQDEVAAFSFVDKFINSGFSTSVSLNICALHDALYSLFLNRNKQRILILYFHNQGSRFSRNFCSYLSNEDMKNLLDKYFIILGWDIVESTFHDVLCDSLRKINQLELCVEMIRQQQSAAIFITSIDMNFEICSIMRSSEGLDDFRLSLEILIECFCTDTQETMDMSRENNESSDNSGYEEFQQRMFDGLGDRDYDLFEADEMEHLKEKIAFALFGMPIEESGYVDKQKEERDKMYEQILKVNNEFSEYTNQVVIAVVYNCLLPLDDDDASDAYTPVPVFILRKCRESDRPCRNIIDHTRRVYESWKDYLEKNKFCKCLMVVPQDGRYTGDEFGKVKLEKVKSPACKAGKKVLAATDTTSAVLGLGSSGVLVAAAIPAIAVAPIALIGATAVGAGVGIYSIGRSIQTLIDRRKHKESLNVTEAEARGAYINIAAGAVGFAGAGANIAVSQLAANGVSIGTTTRIAVNTLGVANIGIGGLAVGNSAVEIIMRWWIDDEAPSTFTVLQLSTSILFFSHAVYSFKTAGTLIEEAQTNVLDDYKNMLKSNKQRKMFRKMELDTIRLNDGDVIKGRADVIAATLKIKNKDEVFAFLARSNKKFNDMGIRFSAKGGLVSFNGIPVDLSEITSLSRSEVYSYFSNLSHKSTSSISTSSSMNFNFGGLSTIDNIIKVSNLLSTVVHQKSLREKIITILKVIFDQFGPATNVIAPQIVEFFNQQFPNSVRHVEYMKMILSFIKKAVELLLEKFRNGETDNLYDFISKYVVDLDELQRKILFMQLICDEIILSLESPSNISSRLELHIMEWAINAAMTRQEIEQQEVHRESTNCERIACDTCTGYYFK